MLKKFLALALLLFFVTGCANQAAFLSSPPGAQVFVDGENIGVTPCVYDYKTSTGRDYQVVIKKAGYEKLEEEVKADQVDTSARNKWLAAGVVWSPLWLGTFFTKKLKDSYEFILQKSSPVMNAQVDTADRGPIL